MPLLTKPADMAWSGKSTFTEQATPRSREKENNEEETVFINK